MTRNPVTNGVPCYARAVSWFPAPRHSALYRHRLGALSRWCLVHINVDVHDRCLISAIVMMVMHDSVMHDHMVLNVGMIGVARTAVTIPVLALALSLFLWLRCCDRRVVSVDVNGFPA